MAKWVSFKTKRGRKVKFKLTGRGHRRTSWNNKFAAAGRACYRKRHKPGSKAFGSCMKSALKGSKKARC